MEHQNEIKTIEAEINTLLSLPYKTINLPSSQNDLFVQQKTVVFYDDLIKLVGEKRAILKNLKK